MNYKVPLFYAHVFPFESVYMQKPNLKTDIDPNSYMYIKALQPNSPAITGGAKIPPSHLSPIGPSLNQLLRACQGYVVCTRQCSHEKNVGFSKKNCPNLVYLGTWMITFVGDITHKMVWHKMMLYKQRHPLMIACFGVLRFTCIAAWQL